MLTGHATVRSDDVLITADEIELLGKDFTVALATGSVRVVDAKRGIDLTADDLWYDRKAKIARIRGSAEMVDLENEIVVKGGYLEDRDAEGLTIIQIGVRIFRKDMVCRSEFAKYWRDRKILELTGMPWVSRERRRVPGREDHHQPRHRRDRAGRRRAGHGGRGRRAARGRAPCDARPPRHSPLTSRPTRRHRCPLPPEGTLSLEGLAKSYGAKQAVREVTFAWRAARSWACSGPTARARPRSSTWWSASSGRPRAGSGWTATTSPACPMYRRARLGISYLPQEPSVFRKLSVEDNVAAILETRPHLSGRDRRVRLDALLDELGIRHLRRQKAWTLSGGERRRTEIARALAIEPKFLLLDEPFAGIDPITVSELKRIVQDLSAKGIGVLITDHNVRDTLQITHRSHIINLGEVLVSGTREELLQNELARRIYLGHEFEG